MTKIERTYFKYVDKFAISSEEFLNFVDQVLDELLSAQLEIQDLKKEVKQLKKYDYRTKGE
jgi:cell division septum initiation protein DivIVA